MVNTPIPTSLKSEAKKAAKILRDFTVPNAKSGPDKLIPAGIICKARGLAIITVVKAGFLVTARGGSGIVIAKTDGDDWSAPSAIGLAGLGGGFEIGAEVTDFVIILNKKSAVDAFSKGGNLTLGGNFTIAAGPLGRNIEGDVSVRNPAAIYTYSKTRGLFAGISIEGTALIERKDANRKFYEDKDIRAIDILSGKVEPPPVCDPLYEVLHNHKKAFEKAALHFAKDQAVKHASAAAEPYLKDKFGSSFTKSSSTKTVITKSSSAQSITKTPMTSYSSSKVVKSTSAHGHRHSGNSVWYIDDVPASHSSQESSPQRAVALYDFSPIMACDLQFKEGDEILLLTQTEKQFDWWEGKCNGKTGIFPANYVKVR